MIHKEHIGNRKHKEIIMCHMDEKKTSLHPVTAISINAQKYFDSVEWAFFIFIFGKKL